MAGLVLVGVRGCDHGGVREQYGGARELGVRGAAGEGGGRRGADREVGGSGR